MVKAKIEGNKTDVNTKTRWEINVGSFIGFEGLIGWKFPFSTACYMLIHSWHHATRLRGRISVATIKLSRKNCCISCSWPRNYTTKQCRPSNFLHSSSVGNWGFLISNPTITHDKLHSYLQMIKRRPIVQHKVGVGVGQFHQKQKLSRKFSFIH